MAADTFDDGSKSIQPPVLSSQPDTMAPNPCYFLEMLPKELRLNVYEYLVKPSEIHIKSKDEPTLSGLSKQDIAATEFHTKGFNDDSLHLALLRTCRMIYNEALPILTRPSILVMHPSAPESADDDDDGPVVDASWLPQLHLLDTLRLTLGTVPNIVTEDLQHSQFLANCLGGKFRLKSLELVIDEYPALESSDAEIHTTKLDDLAQ